MKKRFLITTLGAGLLVALASCGSDDYKLSVVAPQGAPAVSVASLAVNDKDSYSFIDANNIAKVLTVDFIFSWNSAEFLIS